MGEKQIFEHELNLSDETIRIWNFLSVESYDEKNAEICRNSYIAEKCIVSKLLKIFIPNLIAKIEDFKQDCVKISYPYL